MHGICWNKVMQPWENIPSGTISIWGCVQFRGNWWSTFAAVCLALNSNLKYVSLLDGDCVEYVIFCFKQNTEKTLRAKFKFRQNIELQTMLPSSIKKRKEKARCFSNSCFSWLWPAGKGPFSQESYWHQIVQMWRQLDRNYDYCVGLVSLQ